VFEEGDPVAVGAFGTDRPLGSSPAGDVLDRVLARYRAIATAQAAFLAAVAEFVRSRPALVGERVVAGACEFAVDELAAELRLSRAAAAAYIDVAVTLAEDLPGTAAALAAGDLDLPKARVVVEGTATLDRPVRQAVEELALPKAPDQTVGQLRAGMSRAVLAADPDGAQVRHERAVVERRVAISALPDGMAELWALLPAPAAAAIYTAIDQHGRRPGQPSDVPVDARRADALVDLVTRHAVGAGGTPAASAGAGRPTTAEAASSCAAAVAARPALAPLVQVTVAASTLLRLDNQPAELAGHGPIPAEMARQVAADPSGTWRRILTDPATGTVLDIGNRSYRPSRPLARYVAARDATCRFPGCRQPARRCDLDHVTPWPAGPTTAANLIAVCRHHHRLKHSGRWQVRAARDGTVTWTAPTGRTYTTRPPPVADLRMPPHRKPPALPA
jgi:Domain of unknown function (DUF222)